MREHFGLSGFGANAVTQDAGGTLVVPHDELEFGGQEELYVVIEGRARFTCDGEDVEIGAGAGRRLPRRASAQRRRARAPPTTLLMVSGGSVQPNL